MSRISLEDAIQRHYGMTVPELRAKALSDSFVFSKGIAGFRRLGDAHRRACGILDAPDIEEFGMVMPRATGKSSTIKGKLLQLICKYPNIRILYISKTQGRAAAGVRDLRNRLMGIDAVLLPVLFPEVVPKNKHEVRWSGAAFEVNRTRSWDEATVEAAGVGTNKTGFHYDVLFFDDPLSPDKDDIRAEDIMFSDEEVQKVIGYMQLTTLGMFEPKGLHLTLFAGTRYATNDIISWIKDHWPQMTMFEETIEDKDGNMMFPEFWTRKMLDKEKRTKGNFFFMSQFYNRPVDLTNKVFRMEDIQTFDRAPKLKNGFVSIQIDPSQGKSGARGRKKCATAVSAFVTADDGRLCVLDYHKGAYGLAATIKHALKLADRYDPDVIGFESVGAQDWIEAELRNAQRQGKRRWRIEAIKRSRVSKDARILEIQPSVQNHDLYLRPWMQELRRELDDFPYGEKDLLDNLADHIKLTNKYGASLPYQIRVRGLGDAEVTADSIPNDTGDEKYSVIYMVPSPDGTSGFVLSVTKHEDVLFVTDAISLGEGDFDLAGILLDAVKGRQVVTSREVWNTFFKGSGISARKRDLRSKFPADAAVARISRGDVKLAEAASVLTGYATPLGLEAIEFMAENCGKKSGLQVIPV